MCELPSRIIVGPIGYLALTNDPYYGARILALTIAIMIFSVLIFDLILYLKGMRTESQWIHTWPLLWVIVAMGLSLIGIWHIFIGFQRKLIFWRK